MGALQNIRLGFRRRALLRILGDVAGISKKRLNLDTASTVGLLFDGTNPEVQQAVLDYNDTLRIQYKKKVQMLGFVDIDREDTSLPFPSFSRKQMDWALRPTGKAVEQFLQPSYDLLIVLSPLPHPVLEFVAAQVKAHLKVGPFSDDAPVFDVMIDHPNASIPQFIREIETLLKKTNSN